MLAARFPNTSCDIGQYVKPAILLATIPLHLLTPYNRHLSIIRLGAFSDAFSEFSRIKGLPVIACNNRGTCHPGLHKSLTEPPER